MLSSKVNATMRRTKLRRRITLPAAPGFVKPKRMHPAGSCAARLLCAAAVVGQLPQHLAVVGVEPGAVDTGVGLSQAVNAALRPAAAAAAELIDELVRRFGPKTASV